MQHRPHLREIPQRTAGRTAAAVAATALAVALAFVAACSTPRGTAGSAEEANATTAEPAATPSPTPTPEPTPVQPRAMYRVMVSTEDGGMQEALIDPESSAPPVEETAESESPEPTPTADATPESTPAPGGNFVTNLWRKVFPGKSPPTEMAAQPEPTPDIIRVPTPREGIFSRMWHMVFPRKQPPPAALPPQWIGTIQLIHESGGYALIDTQGFVAPPPGEILRSVGGDMETGSLKISADRNPPFFIADIVGGRPQPGDRVYSPTAP